MSNSFAFGQLGGQLSGDPESRSTPGGLKIVSFSIPVEQGYKDNKTTAWFRVKAFGEAATFAEKYLKKGSSVRLTGVLQINSWEDKQTGQKKQSVEILTHKIDFGDSGQKSGGSAPATRQAAAPPARQQATPAPRAAAEAESDPFDDGDSIPF